MTYILQLKRMRHQTRGASERVLDFASWSAMVWTSTAFGAAILTSLSLTGPVPAHMVGPSLMQFFTQIGLGQAWLATILGAGILAVLSFAVRAAGSVVSVAGFGLAVLLPLALQGHAAGAENHAAASTALWLHAAGVSVWIGGLATLIVVFRGTARVDSLQMMGRFSTLALVGFAVVGISGVISAVLRVQRPDQLFTTMYGALVLVKVFVIVTLAIAGYAQRRWVLRRLARSPGRLWRRWVGGLVLSELMLLGIAAGTGSVVARTPSPIAEKVADSVVQRLTGEVLPLIPDLVRVFDTWTINPSAMVAACLAIGAYTTAVLHARRAGQWWPASRVVFWGAGWAMLLWVTCGPAGVFATFTFTGFVVVQSTLIFLVPFLLVLGRPLRLMNLTVAPRSDGSRGLREWADAAASTTVARWWRIPAVSGGVLLLALASLYLTPWLTWAVQDPLGRDMTFALVTVGGAGFVWSLRCSAMDSDRTSAAAAVAVALGFVLGVAYIAVVAVFKPGGLLPDWFGVTVAAWRLDPITDQLSGAVTLWVVAAVAGIAQQVMVSVEIVRAGTQETAEETPSRAGTERL